MPKFTFTLDGVLRQRKQIEEQRQRELAVVQAELSALEAELRGMDRSVQESTADVRSNHLVGQLDLAYLAAHRRYTVAMQRKAMALAQQMVAVKTRLEATRKALLEAAKRRKIIEKLRENRKTHWAEDQARRETAALDEVGAQIGYRNVMERFRDSEPGIDPDTADGESP
jgi:flagellar FliJ protein